MKNKIPFSGASLDLVRQRYSCRSYSAEPLTGLEMDELRRFSATLVPPYPAPLRLELVDRRHEDRQKMFGAGTYGMIKGARFFAVGILRPDGGTCWLNLGYAMEALILRATALGLQSCWIGGVFDRKAFARLSGDLQAEEIVPAVAALGRAAERRTLRDRLVRGAARGDSRKPAAELFFQEQPGRALSPELEQRFGGLLEQVRLAPSASNKQPWRLLVEEDRLHLFLVRDRGYARLLPKVDLQKIDLGIAMFHLELAAADAGLAGEWRSLDRGLPQFPGDSEYITSFCLNA